MNNFQTITRRDWLAGAAALAAGSFPQWTTAAPPKPKSVAVVATIYFKGSHADVLVGKILEGWKQDGGTGPALNLASLYVEQFPPRELSRGITAKHNVPMYDSIEKAVTVGGNRIPVDGVISIGEHGSYPTNEKGQVLYPRRRFFEEITDTFKKYNRVVPVFSDKHIGPQWTDAKWIYDRAREMKVPFMAGSSLPVSFREPEINVPLGCEMESAVGIGYSGLDIYGSHSLACYQCLVERRRGAETGVKWVQCLEGKAIWKAVDDGVVPRDVLDAALALAPKGVGDVRAMPGSALFLFEYEDGFRGAQFMLPKFGRIVTSVKLKGQQPQATRFEERPHPHHPHFAYLLKGVERMIHTGKPSYPIERTLLVSGILDRALTSRLEGGKKLLTPELSIQYQPADYPHAPLPALTSDPSQPLAK